MNEHGTFFREGITDDNPMGSIWENVDGILTQLDSGRKGIICGVSRHSNIYRRQDITELNPTGTKWQRLPGRLNYISCNDYGCWGKNKRNDVYFTTKIQSEIK